MAHPELRRSPGFERAARAFQDGEEHRALTLLGRLVGSAVPDSAEWAMLERLRGLVLIHVLREVEGTFALERADAVLDRLAVLDQGLGAGTERMDTASAGTSGMDTGRPTLAWLAGAPPEETVNRANTVKRADEDAAPLPLPPSLESP